MLSLAAFLVLSRVPDQISIDRDNFGVPQISAPTTALAWWGAGYAVAQDRLWQMEMSRRTARGRMAEILGKTALASDREVRLTGYTDSELKAQLDSLSPELQEAFSEYSKGVNGFIAEGQLPPEYAKNGFKPEQWTELDSVAIAVRLFQYFGRGGAGAIRNMAALAYLGNQKPIAGHVLDVLDDFLWQNDPTSPTTVAKEDERGNHPMFVTPSRKLTEQHLAMLPKLGLFELLPGLDLASREQSTRLAQRVGAPFHTGSYCMVVNKNRSATGAATLLSGPQMGFTVPSIVHEMEFDAPSLHVVGMDVPGIPGVIIGHTDRIAWGMTSGVADTDDIVYAPKVGDHQYVVDGTTLNLQQVASTIHVKGGADSQVTQLRTADGPVVLNTAAHGSSQGYVFARHTSYFGHELNSMAAVFGLWHAKSAAQADSAAAKATMSFNVFFADTEGHIGYRYGGLMPVRSEKLDPRLPVPAGSRYKWKGMIPPDEMPYVMDPKSGLLTNWNNKPVSWWPNLDTPDWGKIFRVEAIRRSLPVGKLTAQDFEVAAWTIARADDTWPWFEPYVNAAAEELGVRERIGGFDGRLFQGSRQAALYKSFFSFLRAEIFNGTVGNFMNRDLAEMIAQPSVMLSALQGKTKFNYLGKRKPSEVVRDALKAAIEKGGAGYVPSQISLPDDVGIPYANRGTYIQVVELLAGGPSGRNVLPPGVAAAGVHSRDQAPLARAWVYKPMNHSWK